MAILAVGQKIEITKGPVLDAKQIRKDFSVPRLVFGGFSYSTALFFNPEKKRTYSGFGFQNKSFQFAVMENYLTYSGVKELSSDTFSDKVSLNAFVIVNNKMYVLFSMKFKDQDAFTLYVNEVSEDMVVLGSPLALHTYKDLKDYGMGIAVQHSRDKNYLLIRRLYDTKPREKQKIDCMVVDNAFSTIWSTMIETENMDKEVSIRSVDIDNNGNLYCLIEPEVRKLRQPIVYAYFWKSKSLKHFVVGLPKGENFGTSLEILNGATPYIVGLNDDKKKLTYFVNRIDRSSEIIENLGSSLMPADFYKASTFRVFETKNWNVTNMVSLSNNTIAFSVEAMLYDTKYHLYYSYNTYVIAFREDCTEAWSRTIRKKQSAISGLAGHSLIAANDHVLVVYNDHVKNLAKKPEDPKLEVFRGKDGMSVVQQIDPAGKVTKYGLMRDAEMKGYMVSLDQMAQIEPGLYFASCIRIKGILNVESRNITMGIR